jgi:fatty acid desaturase
MASTSILATRAALSGSSLSARGVSPRRTLRAASKTSTGKSINNSARIASFKVRADSGVGYVQHADLYDGSKQTQLYSGLRGQALNAKEKEFPTMAQVLAKIPKECFEKDTAKSLMYAGISTAITLGVGLAAWATLPFTMYYLPAWIAYAYVAGTAATGCWVAAHECGHGAFSDNRTIQDTVGYILHSLLLVPYFSWQRSHAVHHSRTNHVSEGETHVPAQMGSEEANFTFGLRKTVGKTLFSALNLVGVFLFGWPLYLLMGASGGPVRGKTNHFVPKMGASGKHALFPGKWENKVWYSDIGVALTVGLMAYWAMQTSFATVFGLYVAPYLFTNFWLVLYTWLQHTDVDVPHFEGDDWNLVKGAFMTIDRPYGKVYDFLHHRIGSTHVAHHINHTIPHYNAVKATEAIKQNWPDLYLFDPTPIAQATWRVGSECVAIVRKGDEYVFSNEPLPKLA